MIEPVIIPLAFAALGASMLGLAWSALGEYRKVFLANPRRVISFEVFTMLAEIGGLGYIAAALAFFGVWFLVLALYVTAAVLYGLLFF